MNCTNFQDLLMSLDIFGQGIELRINKQIKAKTVLGGTLSVTMIILLFAMFFFSAQDVLYHKNPQISIEEEILMLYPNLTLDKFNMPILTLIDTPGAYPGIEGEQHAIGHAIALNIREMARMNVPIFSVVMGEASSGGALGIGVANHIYMLEHAQYTVISPEGCASILWRSASFATQAAEALKITAQDLTTFGICDAIIPEPQGGSHYDTAAAFEAIAKQLKIGLATFKDYSAEALKNQRYEKYRSIGAFTEK